MERSPSFDATSKEGVCTWRAASRSFGLHLERAFVTSETDLGRAVQQDMSGEANISNLYTFSGWSQVPAGEMQHKRIYDLMKTKKRAQSGETRDVPANSVDTSAGLGMRALGV